MRYRNRAEKILKFKLDQITTYGIMAEVKEKRIRDIINFLVLNDYIALKNSESPVAKMTEKSKEVLTGSEKLMTKIAKDVEKETKKEPKKDSRQHSKNESGSGRQMVDADTDLFARLKELRYKLAQVQRVPAFVIFTDASLIDMCSKMFGNKEEFLMVSGVGESKMKRYGIAFLEAIEISRKLCYTIMSKLKKTALPVKNQL